MPAGLQDQQPDHRHQQSPSPGKRTVRGVAIPPLDLHRHSIRQNEPWDNGPEDPPARPSHPALQQQQQQSFAPHRTATNVIRVRLEGGAAVATDAQATAAAVAVAAGAIHRPNGPSEGSERTEHERSQGRQVAAARHSNSDARSSASTTIAGAPGGQLATPAATPGLGSARPSSATEDMDGLPPLQTLPQSPITPPQHAHPHGTGLAAQDSPRSYMAQPSSRSATSDGRLGTAASSLGLADLEAEAELAPTPPPQPQPAAARLADGIETLDDVMAPALRERIRSMLSVQARMRAYEEEREKVIRARGGDQGVATAQAGAGPGGAAGAVRRNSRSLRLASSHRNTGGGGGGRGGGPRGPGLRSGSRSRSRSASPLPPPRQSVTALPATSLQPVSGATSANQASATSAAAAAAGQATSRATSPSLLPRANGVGMTGRRSPDVAAAAGAATAPRDGPARPVGLSTARSLKRVQLVTTKKEIAAEKGKEKGKDATPAASSNADSTTTATTPRQNDGATASEPSLTPQASSTSVPTSSAASAARSYGSGSSRPGRSSIRANVPPPQRIVLPGPQGDLNHLLLLLEKLPSRTPRGKQAATSLTRGSLPIIPSYLDLARAHSPDHRQRLSQQIQQLLQSPRAGSPNGRFSYDITEPRVWGPAAASREGGGAHSFLPEQVAAMAGARGGAATATTAAMGGSLAGGAPGGGPSGSGGAGGDPPSVPGAVAVNMPPLLRMAAPQPPAALTAPALIRGGGGALLPVLGGRAGGGGATAREHERRHAAPGGPAGGGSAACTYGNSPMYELYALGLLPNPSLLRASMAAATARPANGAAARRSHGHTSSMPAFGDMTPRHCPSPAACSPAAAAGTAAAVPYHRIRQDLAPVSGSAATMAMHRRAAAATATTASAGGLRVVGPYSAPASPLPSQFTHMHPHVVPGSALATAEAAEAEVMTVRSKRGRSGVLDLQHMLGVDVPPPLLQGRWECAAGKVCGWTVSIQPPACIPPSLSSSTK
ncbi:hypothetical protein VOLCADRAFT_90509 [Volvox carteri f. nagariensis]|uniref:Uncharacterized protein n=1 Tax=Volvox carteri f. nagariensis TaxID=3068 RepID=D8TUK5_VOLCA|nr:uncharacterized protein VOLCADRAFT_90509 [Volvox carteri f. nagariensis]EFJ48724.1 hypothetical protein VOLCADRAFT_90509 [Volvox carteri f. nagariensis]|eukprot:XP_002950056.1 hypothetical protein VOLCADRAFT_90509 [Volvox carteri f. nagariensis]